MARLEDEAGGAAGEDGNQNNVRNGRDLYLMELLQGGKVMGPALDQ